MELDRALTILNADIIACYDSKGVKMKRAKIVSKKEPQKCANGAIQYTFELKYFDEDGNLGERSLWRSAFDGEKSDPEFIEAIKSLQVGSIAEFGFTQSQDKKYWNISSVMPERDVNAELPPPPKQEYKKKDEFKPELSAAQTLMNNSTQIYVAMKNAGEDIPGKDVKEQIGGILTQLGELLQEYLNK